MQEKNILEITTLILRRFKMKSQIKKLARSKHCLQENYVLDRIHHKLSSPNIPFETQYSVEIAGKKYRIDMAFPDLGIGVEVDESHHKNQTDKDIIRHDAIEEHIFGMTIERIDLTARPEEVYVRIDEIVDKIEQAFENKYYHKTTTKSLWNIGNKIKKLLLKPNTAWEEIPTLSKKLPIPLEIW